MNIETKAGRFSSFLSAVISDRGLALEMISRDRSLLDARNSIGETVLHHLVVEGDLDAVNWLVHHGADVNVRNDFDGTPLIDAVTLDYSKIVRYLLDVGAEVNAFDDTDESAITRAISAASAQSGDTSVLDMLLGSARGGIRGLIRWPESVEAAAHPAILKRLKEGGF